MSKPFWLASLLLLAACNSPPPGDGTSGHETAAAMRETAALADSEPPTWIAAPRVLDQTASSARLEFRLNEAAQIGWRVLPIYEDVSPEAARDNAFTSASLFEQDASGEIVDGAQGGVIQQGSAQRVSLGLRQLLPGTRYLVGIQARDASGHTQPTITLLEFRTPYGDIPALAWGSWGKAGSSGGVQSFVMTPESLQLHAQDKHLLHNDPAYTPFLLAAAERWRLYAVAGPQLTQLWTHPLRATLTREQQIALPCPARTGASAADGRHIYLVCQSAQGKTQLLSVQAGTRTQAPQPVAQLLLDGETTGKLLLSPRGDQAWLVMHQPARVQRLRLDRHGGLHAAGALAVSSSNLSLSIDPAGHYLYALDRDQQQLRHYRVDGPGQPSAAGGAAHTPCTAEAPQFSPDGSRALFVHAAVTLHVNTLTGQLSGLPDSPPAACNGAGFNDATVSSGLGPDMRFVHSTEQIDRTLYSTIDALDAQGNVQFTAPVARRNGAQGYASWLFAAADVPSTALQLSARFAVSVSRARDSMSSWTVDARTGALTLVSSQAVGGEPGALLVDHGRHMAFISNQTLNTLSAWSIDSGNGLPSYRDSIGTGAGPHALALEQTFVLDPHESRAILVLNRDGKSIQRFNFHKELNGFSNPYARVAEAFAGPLFTWSLPADAEPQSMVSLPLSRQLLVGLAGHLPGTVDFSDAGQPSSMHGQIRIGNDTPAAMLSVDAGGRFAWLYDPGTGKLRVEVLRALGPSFRAYATQDMPGLVQAPLPEPSGRFAYTASRSDGLIRCWAINKYTGQLQQLPHSVQRSRTPQKMVMDPQGRFLYIIDAGGRSYSVYRPHPATGALQLAYNGISPTALDELGLLATLPPFTTTSLVAGEP